MGILQTLIGGSIAEPINAIGNVFDKLFTSDDERAQAKIVLEKLRQHPFELQAEINKIEASHRSFFVAGWRPAIGWVCAIGLFYDFFLRPILSGVGLTLMPLDTATLHALIMALLGLGGMITAEKFGNKVK